MTRNADVALALSVAALRLLSKGLERDDALRQHADSRVFYVLDANVPSFLVDPIANYKQLRSFGRRGGLGLPEVPQLSDVEEEFLRAFAFHEATELPKLLTRRRTHMFRPHLLETSWHYNRLRSAFPSFVESSVRVNRQQERDNTRRLRELRHLVKQPGLIKKDLFKAFLQSYSSSMLQEVDRLVRYDKLVKLRFFTNDQASRWEQSTHVNRSIQKAVYSLLAGFRGGETHLSEDGKFRLVRDSEVLTLIHQYVADKSESLVFLTFDWSIHKFAYHVENALQTDPSPELQELLDQGFSLQVRHPIIYTSFVSKPEPEINGFRVNQFISDLDLLFIRENNFGELGLDDVLGQIVYKSNQDRANRIVDSSIGNSNIGRCLDVIRNNILFVHEQAAVDVVRTFVFGDNLDGGDKDQVLGNETVGQIDAILEAESIERALEKAAALTVSCAVIPIAKYETETQDEARIIIDEWVSLFGGHASSLSRAESGARQLLRRMPGLIRISDYQRRLLGEIEGSVDAFINSMVEYPGMQDGEELLLLVAQVVALGDKWQLSERCSQIARDISKAVKNQSRRAEAEYWIAVSRRHQRNPGMEKLQSSVNRLEKAIRLACNRIDKLRFQSELVALRISVRFHRHVYGASYGYLGATPEWSPSDLYSELRRLRTELSTSAVQPFGPIETLLGIQLSSNICLLWLLSRGMEPGLDAGVAPSDEEAAATLRSLNQLCEHRRRTIPINIEFVRLSCAYLLYRDVTAAAQLAQMLSFSDDVLIPFDRERLIAFFELCERLEPLGGQLPR